MIHCPYNVKTFFVTLCLPLAGQRSSSEANSHSYGKKRVYKSTLMGYVVSQINPFYFSHLLSLRFTLYYVLYYVILSISCCQASVTEVFSFLIVLIHDTSPSSYPPQYYISGGGGGVGCGEENKL